MLKEYIEMLLVVLALLWFVPSSIFPFKYECILIKHYSSNVLLLKATDLTSFIKFNNFLTFHCIDIQICS